MLGKQMNEHNYKVVSEKLMFAALIWHRFLVLQTRNLYFADWLERPSPFFQSQFVFFLLK